MARPLSRDFYNRDPAVVARGLLGHVLVRETQAGVTSGHIVETEAYLAKGDAACHSSRGQTPRNATMFGPPGHAYIYSIHAKFCFNAVTQSQGTGSAVLIRALEPLDGVELMSRRREHRPQKDLTRGPARLCQALDLDRDLDGWDLTRGEQLWISRGKPFSAKCIGTSSRIGISAAQDLQLRFFVLGNSHLSGPARLNRS